MVKVKVNKSIFIIKNVITCVIHVSGKSLKMKNSLEL